MIKKIIRPVDLGMGDSGKGSFIYDAAKHYKNVSCVLKTGAGSGTHCVVHDGQRMILSQWGCATPLGIPTVLTGMMLIIPDQMIEEAGRIDGTLGIDPWKLLYCDPKAIIVTPYFRVQSQLAEIARGAKPHGTYGSGTGKAYAHAKLAPDAAIYAEDLKSREILRRKLIDIRDYVGEITEAALYKNNFSGQDHVLFLHMQELIRDPGNKILQAIINELYSVGRKLQYLSTADALEKFDGTAINEQSHGVLSDAEYGFKPYVSKIRTIPSVVDDYLMTVCGYTGKISNIGLHRAYEFRHGPGPMPSYEKHLRNRLGIAKSHEENRWRGMIRVGNLDLVQMKYAIQCCGGPEAFDGLAITCFDQILAHPGKAHTWDITVMYLKDGRLLDAEKEMELTTELLETVSPINMGYSLRAGQVAFKDKDFMFNYVKDILEPRLGIKLKCLSYGTGNNRKIWKK